VEADGSKRILAENQSLQACRAGMNIN